MVKNVYTYTQIYDRWCIYVSTMYICVTKISPVEEFPELHDLIVQNSSVTALHSSSLGHPCTGRSSVASLVVACSEADKMVTYS